MKLKLGAPILLTLAVSAHAAPADMQNLPEWVPRLHAWFCRTHPLYYMCHENPTDHPTDEPEPTTEPTSSTEPEPTTSCLPVGASCDPNGLPECCDDAVGTQAQCVDEGDGMPRCISGLEEPTTEPTTEPEPTDPDEPCDPEQDPDCEVVDPCNADADLGFSDMCGLNTGGNTRGGGGGYRCPANLVYWSRRGEGCMSCEQFVNCENPKCHENEENYLKKHCVTNGCACRKGEILLMAKKNGQYNWGGDPFQPTQRCVKKDYCECPSGQKFNPGCARQKDCAPSCDKPNNSCDGVCVEGCECPNGMLFDDNGMKCVHSHQCIKPKPPPQCPSTQQYFDGRGGNCQPCTGTCDNRSPICTADCRAGCGCPKDMYGRDMLLDKNGMCVQPNQCPIQTGQCPYNQQYFFGSGNCQPCTGTCDNRSPICTADCRAGCGCPKDMYGRDMLLDKNGMCVQPNQCPTFK